MTKICEGRVVAITGAGRGIGREYALEFARQGANVVVNDLGAGGDGTGAASAGPAEEVAEEVHRLGGRAVVNGGDVSDFDDARALIDQAVAEFGRLDVLVNNAGILRDRTIANMSPEEWDSVVRVHLRGTFAPTHWAARHWRDRAKAGETVNGRLINTTSSSGLYANAGQANYAAAKAGIASFSIVASRELERYGVTANAVYPTALSRLTAGVFERAGMLAGEGADFDPVDPGNIAPLVVWLGSQRSAAVTGRVFGVRGGRIVVADGWVAGPTVDVERRWDPVELDEVVAGLLAEAPANAGTNGLRPEGSTT
ncbi:MAG: SDR family oxidoreductase [Desertimonas sp.]